MSYLEKRWLHVINSTWFCILSWKRWLHVINSTWFCSLLYLCINCWMDSSLNCHLFRYYSLAWLAHTTNTPIGVVWGDGEPRSGNINTEQSQTISIDAIFRFTYHIKQLKLTNHSCGELQATDCLSRRDGAILNDCGHLTSLRNKSQQKQPGNF